MPPLNVKTGVSFGYGNLLGWPQYTFVSDQFTNASNVEQNVNDNLSGIKGEIPAYYIMDHSLSWSYRYFTLEAGTNNVLDVKCFTRRATGYPGP